MFAGNSNINKLKSLFFLFHIVCFCLFLIAGDWRQVETAWTAGIAGSACRDCRVCRDCKDCRDCRDCTALWEQLIIQYLKISMRIPMRRIVHILMGNVKVTPAPALCTRAGAQWFIKVRQGKKSEFLQLVINKINEEPLPGSCNVIWTLPPSFLLVTSQKPSKFWLISHRVF